MNSPEPETETGADACAVDPADMHRPLTPRQGYDPRSCAARFLSSATFGLFLDILILCVYGAAVMMGFRPGIMGLLYTLIEVPVIWGILGIFFYSEMLDLAWDLAVRAPFVRRWYRFGL